jgi:Ni/Fe-hydrogenase subunit HybB-like protein
MNSDRLGFLRQSFFWWVLGLTAVILTGLSAAYVVFTQGLVVTNLTDLVPWGLWITIDLSCIALSAGAFLLSAAVYLLGLKRLQPVARTAVFIGLIGYSMAVMMLLLDIGRPDRFWHGMVYWNVHSPLWEVTMCVALYFTVLALEVTPIIGESSLMQDRWPGLGNLLGSVHKLAPVLAIAGLSFSMLHQSSLGATYGILKARPFWFKPSLAVLFMASAMVGGLCLTVFASRLAARISPKATINDDLLDTVARFAGWALVIYLYLRVWDLLATEYTYLPGRSEGFEMLTKGALGFQFWGGEIVLGIVVPMVILLSSRLRRHDRFQMLALLLVVVGVVAYRWNTNLVGQLVVLNNLIQGTMPVYTSYVPSRVEIAAGAGVIAYGLLMFSLGVRYLRVVDHGTGAEAEAESGLAHASPQLAATGD